MATTQQEYEKTQGLNNAIFEFCMRHNDDPSKRTEGIPERDPADYEWLKQALAQIESEDDRMKNCLGVLRSDADTGSKEIAMEEILYYVEDLDHAVDFCKTLKGSKDVIAMLGEKTPQTLRDGAANILGTLAQNNIICQAILLADGILPVLTTALLADKPCRTRLLYALSSCVRGNPATITAFFKDPHGLPAVLKCVSDHKTDVRSCKKALFFLTCLWRDEKQVDARPPPPSAPEHLAAVKELLGTAEADVQELAAEWVVQLLAHGAGGAVKAAGIAPDTATEPEERQKLKAAFEKAGL